MDEQDRSDTSPPRAKRVLKWRKRKLFPRVGPNGEPLPPQELAVRSEYMREYARRRKAQLKAGAPKHGKPGRPRQPGLEFRFEPTQEQREVVKLLSGFAVSKDRICKCVRNPDTRRPIGVHTLERAFADELDTGAAELNALVVGKLAKKIQEGNIVAIIWTMKNLYGWADHREVHSTGELDAKIELTPEELARQLEARGLPSYVFGVDKPVLELDAPPRINGNGQGGGGNGNGSSEPED